MNKTINMLRISSSLAKYYFKARKVNKSKNVDDEYDVVRDLAKSVIKSYKKDLEVINLEYTNDLDGAIIISNHQENLDIFLLIEAFKSRIKFVAKKELFEIPFFKTFIEASNSHSIDRSDPRQGVKLFKEVVKDVNEQNSNVVVFPEGTRSKVDLMSDFNSGLFNILRKVNKPIVPVYVDGSYSETTRHIKVIIGKPILHEEYDNLKGVELKNLVYQKICDIKKEFGSKTKQYTVLGLGDSLTFGENHQSEYTDGYFYEFTKQLEMESLLKKQYNLAIPKSSIQDVVDIIDNNNYSSLLKANVNKNIDSTFLNKLINQHDDSVFNIIKNADLLLMTCGANDLLSIVKKGKVSNQEIHESFKELFKKTSDLITKITTINPQLKIILIGLYFPYPHIEKFKQYDQISVLDLYYNKLENKFKNLKRISIYKEVEKNKSLFLPDERNIHLSQEGYSFVKNKVAKEFQKMM